jgi:hypothetical protein
MQRKGLHIHAVHAIDLLLRQFSPRINLPIYLFRIGTFPTLLLVHLADMRGIL